MRERETFDIAIIGGGIVGLATGMNLFQRYAVRLAIVEAEGGIARHQTGHNSGVIHSGLYYKPGSHRARNCVEGRETLYRFCQEHGIAHNRCGKLVVAVEDNEVARLDDLEKRGLANGLLGLKRLSSDQIRDYEPHVCGKTALLVPETGIVDYKAVAVKYAELIDQAGGVIDLATRVTHVHRRCGEIILSTSQGDVHSRHLINCAGLQSDRVARMCGMDSDIQIIPFRGEFYELVPRRQHLVKNLIYPVPDPRFPFLGVHFTRTVHGPIEAGPNAVLAFKREGYTLGEFSLRDCLQMAGYSGFWRLVGRHWRTGIGELHRSLSQRAFYHALKRMMPDLQYDDICPAGSGVRAQAVDRQGNLVDDFRFVQAERMIHVLNAPSPAATASLAIGASIAEMAGRQFGLREK